MFRPKGFKHTTETIEKMKIVKLGKKHSLETCTKISQSKIGKIHGAHSNETKEKIRQKALGRTPWNKGKKSSNETKQKQSIALKGKSTWAKGKKFSNEHKRKISISNRESWKPNIKCSYGKQGHHRGIQYDSSYELKFMQLLDEYKIPYERADNKKFRVKYVFENREHYYYPDFYLPREDSIVELKPYFKLKDLKTQVKLEAAKQLYGNKFILVTEKELSELIYGNI